MWNNWKFILTEKKDFMKATFWVLLLEKRYVHEIFCKKCESKFLVFHTVRGQSFLINFCNCTNTFEHFSLYLWLLSLHFCNQFILFVNFLFQFDSYNFQLGVSAKKKFWEKTKKDVRFINLFKLKEET